MDARTSPTYLREVAVAVTEFRRAFTSFMELHVLNDFLVRGVAPSVFPRDDAEADEIARRAQAVDEAAGRASAAPGLTNCLIAVRGIGTIDPIAAWHSITKPKPLLEPDDIISACGQMLGRLDGMVRKAESAPPPSLAGASMHPLMWSAASRLWRDGHYRQAVAAASEALVGQVKVLTGRNDLPETALWQETFSANPPEPGKPRLRWPGAPTDRGVMTMNDGLRLFAAGVQMTIRNPATHHQGDFTEHEASERLATLSLLARWVDECRLMESAD